MQKKLTKAGLFLGVVLFVGFLFLLFAPDEILDFISNTLNLPADYRNQAGQTWFQRLMP